MQLCMCHQCEMLAVMLTTIKRDSTLLSERMRMGDAHAIDPLVARGSISLISFVSSRLQTVRGESRLQTSH